MKLTAPILLDTGRARAAAFSLLAGSCAACTIFVKRIVAPMFVPAKLHKMTTRTPTNYMVGIIWRFEALTSHTANFKDIDPALGSESFNCKNANKIRLNGTLGRAVKNCGEMC